MLNQIIKKRVRFWINTHKIFIKRGSKN